MALLLDYTSLFYAQSEGCVEVIDHEDFDWNDCEMFDDGLLEHDLEDAYFSGDNWEKVVAFEEDGPDGFRNYSALVKIKGVWWHFDLLYEYTAIETGLTDQQIEQSINRFIDA